MPIRVRMAFVVFSIGLLASCGGSSGKSETSTPPAQGAAQGVYEGSVSNGHFFEAIVLPDDSFYAVYGGYTGDIFAIGGLIYGTGQESGSSFTGTMTDFEYPGTPIGTANLSGTFAAGSSLNGNYTEGALSLSFTATVPSTTRFNYNTAAQASTIAGSWTGSLLDGEAADISIDAAGNVSGLSSLACSFTGTATPSTSGKNFYTVTLTFGGSPCVAAGQKATGVAVVETLSDGTNQVIAGLRNSGNTLATVYVGTPAP